MKIDAEVQIQTPHELLACNCFYLFDNVPIRACPRAELGCELPSHIDHRNTQGTPSWSIASKGLS